MDNVYEVVSDFEVRLCVSEGFEQVKSAYLLRRLTILTNLHDPREPRLLPARCLTISNLSLDAPAI